MSQKIILIVDCFVPPSLLKINSMIYIYICSKIFFAAYDLKFIYIYKYLWVQIMFINSM